METIIPSLFFKVEDPGYQRQRLELDDGDFLDLDWLQSDMSSDHLMIISHGLEGSSGRHYVKRSATYFQKKGWDILAWNCRSCSGQMNRLPKFYHHGATEDLSAVVDEALGRSHYKTIVLLGVSMGGSMSIKYVGESTALSDKIKSVVTFSVPCNLNDSAEQLKLKSNRFYEKRFVKKLIQKVKMKSAIHPEIDISEIDSIQDFDSFHQRYTLPIYGYAAMEDFYEEATCDRYFDGIDVPTLVCNAENDPLLGSKCYPRDYARHSQNLSLEIPKVGGHVGFAVPSNDYTYMEYRAEDFLNSLGVSP
jgi:predicted alpha/beta-fold hydrolase